MLTVCAKYLYIFGFLGSSMNGRFENITPYHDLIWDVL